MARLLARSCVPRFVLTLLAASSATELHSGQAASLVLPLTRRVPATSTSSLVQLPHRHLEKIKRSTDAAKAPENVVNEEIALRREPDAQFTLPVRVGVSKAGEPAQEVHVILDTGSTNVWVASTLCTKGACLKHTRYDPSLSETYQAQCKPGQNGAEISVQFGTGSLTGPCALETVTFGSSTPDDERRLQKYVAHMHTASGELAKAAAEDGPPKGTDDESLVSILELGRSRSFLQRSSERANADARDTAERHREAGGRSESKKPMSVRVTDPKKPPSTAVTVQDVAVHLVHTEVGSVFSEINFEGLFGLGFPDMAAEGLTPLFDKMLEERDGAPAPISNPEFAFFYSRALDSAVVMLGGVDDQFIAAGPDGKKPQATMIPVVKSGEHEREHYWSVKLREFWVGNEKIQGAPDQLIFDTGTTLFTAPPELLKTILPKMGASEHEVTRPCGELASAPKLKYVVDAGINEETQESETYEIVLEAEDYFTEAPGGHSCTPSWMQIDVPAPHGPAMLLGELFMRKYVVIFKRGKEEGQSRVGLAPAADGAGVRKALIQLGALSE